jgi:hypothetical protein
MVVQSTLGPRPFYSFNGTNVETGFRSRLLPFDECRLLESLAGS